MSRYDEKIMYILSLFAASHRRRVPNQNNSGIDYNILFGNMYLT